MLAAGVGRRLGDASLPPKVLLRFGGETLLARHASYALSLDNIISSARRKASVSMVNGGAIRMRSPSMPPPRINTRSAKHALTRSPAWVAGRNDRLGPSW